MEAYSLPCLKKKKKKREKEKKKKKRSLDKNHDYDQKNASCLMQKSKKDSKN